jgi:hypothetical protein
MLVVLMEQQLLAPGCICQTCPLADRSGQPRWQQGQLQCGQEIRPLSDHHPQQYRCLMGFRIANIHG